MLKKRDYEGGRHGPLDGIRVLDLSRLVAGNTLTGVLADFGAEVIKVETGEGDTLRAWRTKGVQTNWKLYARNKKSLALDLRNAKAKDLLLKLVEKADVFVESFRPGTLEKMELGPEVLLARNAKLIVVRISGWGQTGPYRRRPGFGTLVEGISGFASFNGFEDREPVLPPMYMADSYAGLYGASGVLVALREAEVNGGRGQVIDLPLLDPIISILGPEAASYRVTGEKPQRTGSRSLTTSPRNVYATKDRRYIAISASIQAMAERVFRAIGKPEMIDDPRFRTNTDRVRHIDECDGAVAEFIAARTLDENMAVFQAAEVTANPVYEIDQLIADEHIQARGVIVEAPDDEAGGVLMHNIIPRLSGTPGKLRRPAPMLGQHTREVLGEIGYSVERIAALAADGVVKA
jgi:formyl-CoA transferase